MFLGKPIFPGESAVDQLVEIIKILGTPTFEQIKTMNPDFKEFKFPNIKPFQWNKVSCFLRGWGNGSAMHDCIYFMYNQLARHE